MGNRYCHSYGKAITTSNFTECQVKSVKLYNNRDPRTWYHWRLKCRFVFHVDPKTPKSNSTVPNCNFRKKTYLRTRTSLACHLPLQQWTTHVHHCNKCWDSFATHIQNLYLTKSTRLHSKELVHCPYTEDARTAYPKKHICTAFGKSPWSV